MNQQTDDKIQVLLVTGILTKEHGNHINQMLRTLLESTGRFTVKITEEFRGATAETLAPYDLVLVNYDGKSWPTDKAVRWGESAEQALFEFVATGKGAAFYHSSIWVDPHWPDEYVKLIGGCCGTESGSRRSPNGDFTVRLAPGPHPITDGLQASWMVVNDDLFAGSRWHPQAQVEVLASVFDDLNDYRIAGFPPPHHPVVIPDGDLARMVGVNQDQAIAWTNRYGKGRTFTITLGHEQDTLRRFGFVALLLRGLEWAATGKVTIPPPDRSGANRLKPWPYY